ncbi:hypothetical protein SAMN05421759_12919 [Roseivivax lentus]|uniref:Uncharacterized protein n=1 Tax=Roseivivax lentus TaxID=633194 RepID=A0A1N7Q619_9RHOB|nr:hypothetical protein [Roseivivax lentus]SIT18302.1 hypothetical protein SAMN05421759_12919 [Roseivivax lentus]
MENLTSKTVAIFSQPFNVPGFDETLPAGEYGIETELMPPPNQRDPDAWKASVILTLHPRTTHPGLSRTLSLSLADLDYARARDKLTGKELSDFFFEEMLADPMVLLVMKADGVSETQLRNHYSVCKKRPSISGSNSPAKSSIGPGLWDKSSIQAAENEGMPPRQEGAASGLKRLNAGQV